MYTRLGNTIIMWTTGLECIHNYIGRCRLRSTHKGYHFLASAVVPSSTCIDYNFLGNVGITLN